MRDYPNGRPGKPSHVSGQGRTSFAAGPIRVPSTGAEMREALARRPGDWLGTEHPGVHPPLGELELREWRPDDELPGGIESLARCSFQAAEPDQR
jgi:hypothetical protein